MKDITPFLSKSLIKRELAMVYVHRKDGNTYAVATDAFRLVEIKLDEFLNSDNLPTGYYTASNWKIMTKAYNAKKQDLQKFSDTIKANEVFYKDMDNVYPDYEKIIPKPDELTPLQLIDVDRDYFVEFLQMIDVDGFKRLKLSEIKSGKNNIIYYKSDNMQILLMGLRD